MDESSQSLEETSKMSSDSSPSAADTHEIGSNEPSGIPNPGDGAQLVSAYSYEKCRRALVEFIIKDEMSFKMVESKAFRALCRHLEPRFEVPDRMTIYRDLLVIYKEDKEMLKGYFKASKQRVSLTTDTWTSPDNLNYICVTAHYVDQDWKFQKRIIMFCQVKGHTGTTVGQMLEKCLVDWGIYDVFGVTLDNVNASDVAIEYLKSSVIGWTGATERAEYLHVRCAANVLALVVKDVVSHYNKSVSRIRSVVKYVTKCPARLAKFRDCAFLERVKCEKSLILDVENSWSSTYLMLDIAEKYEKAFKRLERTDKDYKKKFISSEDIPAALPGTSDFEMEDSSSSSSSSSSESDGEIVDTNLKGGKPNNKNKRQKKACHYAPCAEDWACARGLVECLKVFFDATVEFSASTQVTANSFLWQLVIIREGLVQLRDNASSDPFVASVANHVFLKYREYWGVYENMNSALFFARLLDPREKEGGLKFDLECLYEQDRNKVQSVMENVKQDLVRLFKEYKSIYSTSIVDEVETPVAGQELSVEARLRARWKRFKRDKDAAKESLELDRYLMADREPDDDNFDILAWWQANSTKYEILSHMAKDILAMPVSSVASESAFSTGKRVLSPWRSSLSARTLEALLFTQSSLQKPIALDFLRDYVPDDTSSIEEELLGRAPVPWFYWT